MNEFFFFCVVCVRLSSSFFTFLPRRKKLENFLVKSKKRTNFSLFLFSLFFLFFSLLFSFLSRLDKTKTSLSQKLFFRFTTTRKEEDKQHKEDKDKDELKRKKKKRARRKEEEEEEDINNNVSKSAP